VSITITADGNLRFIWADELSDLVQSGKPTITRASDVEPLPDGRWIADMGRVNGPVLGPFNKRVEALAAERRWLEGKGY
jgi:hypothetical protein